MRLRGEAQKTRIVLSHRHLGREVLELIAGQAELRKDDQPGAGGARLPEKVPMARQILVEQAEARRRLNESNAKRLHQLSLAPVVRSGR